MRFRNLVLPAVVFTAGICVYAQKPRIKEVPAESTSAASGVAMYKEYCATCHGVDGKGGGPAAAAMKKTPTDLTQLSAKNGGKFPAYEVANTLESNEPVFAHGSKDMPVWGNIFRSMSGGEATTRLRVSNLTDYLKSLQSK